MTTTTALQAQLEEMERRKDGAYEERNRVVAALAKCFPSGVARPAIEGWSEDWHGCVYIDLPTGQVSWHFHESQAHLFAGLPAYTKPWDGHDTPEKYRRVAALSAPAQDAPADERAAFEAWIAEEHPTTWRELVGREENSPFTYCYAGIGKQWRAWQARAARTQPATPPAAQDAAATVPVPFKPETWPVDADGFAPSLCTECGTPVRYGSRHSDCGRKAMGLPVAPRAAPTAAQPLYGIVDPDYARAYSIIRCTAWMYGYAVGMHGSFTRDLDLILVPWTDKAVDAEKLLPALADRTGTTVQHGSPSDKPHGRKAWTLLLPGFTECRWIDISVMPRSAPTPQAPALVPLTDDPIRELLAKHQALLEESEHTYFELAYTRQTGFMAWITDKPLASVVVNPDRKVIVSGQGGTADEACTDALQKLGITADTAKGQG